jgi:hypothetical protein
MRTAHLIQFVCFTVMILSGVMVITTGTAPGIRLTGAVLLIAGFSGLTVTAVSARSSRR